MIPSRPLDFGGIINEALRIIKLTWWRTALLYVLCSIPSVLVLLVGVHGFVAEATNSADRYLGRSEENLQAFRDYTLAHSSRTDQLTLYRIQFPSVVDAVDSVREVVQTAYPDSSVARATLQVRVDSIVNAANRGVAPTFSQFVEPYLQSLYWIGAGMLLLLLTGAAFTVGSYDIAARAFEQRALPLARVLKQSVQRWMWLLVVQYVAIGMAMLVGLGLVVGLGSVLGVFGEVMSVLFAFGLVIYALVRVSFAPVALVSEDLGPIEAVKRSFELTAGYWWRIVGVLILSAIMIVTASTIVRLPFSFMAQFNEQFLIDVIHARAGSVQMLLQHVLSMLDTIAWVGLIPNALVASLFPAVITTFYYDLRTRLDGPLEYHSDTTQLTPAADTPTSGSSNPSEPPAGSDSV
ncbi:MAG: hypothetical protein JSS75_13290 [Bacteroidetes bacterium]|nr:hypothetical protein [Bacteroidota bacterium]